MGDKGIIERFDLKQPSLGRCPKKLVFHTYLNLMEYNKLKNKKKESTSNHASL
jgi:hypothetical protein